METALKDAMASRVIQVPEEIRGSREARVAQDPREMTESQVTPGWIMTNLEVLVQRVPRATGGRREIQDQLDHLGLLVMMNVKYWILS